jgi:hypothetical protein
VTARQRELARHALGLTDGRTRSYRNAFVCGKSHPDFADWKRMVRKGLASGRSGKAMFGGDDVFWLTRKGAQAALGPGESLDPEDFPPGAG